MIATTKRRRAGPILAAAIIIACAAASGCRTGIRRVSSAIEGQGVSAIDWNNKPEEQSFSYLTSENTAFGADGVNIELDPKTGKYVIRLDSIDMVRTPSENQQFFAGQLRQGRQADTEALAAYANITGAVVEGAVKAAIEALVPITTVRQEQHTARTDIRAERDVDLAGIHAEAAAAHAGGAE